VFGVGGHFGVVGELGGGDVGRGCCGLAGCVFGVETDGWKGWRGKSVPRVGVGST